MSQYAPNTRFQRTRSRASLARSPLKRRPLGRIFRPTLSWLRSVRSVLAFALLFVALPLSSDQKKVAPLDNSDFSLGPLTDTLAADKVRSILGTPIAIKTSPNFVDPDAPHSIWQYREGFVDLTADGLVFGITATGPEWATHRGVRVGEPIEKVQQLYGPSDREQDDAFDYLDPGDGSELHLIEFTVSNRSVTRIYVGWVLD